MIDVLIVDDNPIVRGALRAYLEGTDEVRVVGEAGNGREALAIASRLQPAVTLLDHRMPLADGLSIVTTLARYTSVLAITSDDSPDLIAAMLRGGAQGYLVHGQFEPPDLLRAVRAVAAGQGWLSPIAAGVAAAVMRGQLDRDREARRRAEHAELTQRRYGLTRREREILGLLSQGLPNATIARRLDLSEKTVKNHLNHIFAKLGVGSRTEAVVVWSGGGSTAADRPTS